MKKFQLFFTVILLPLDFLMIMLAGLSAYYLRFSELSTDIRPVIFSLPFADYLQVLAVISLAWILVFAMIGLYNISEIGRFKNELRKIIFGCSGGLVLIVIYIFFVRELFSSRFIVLVGWFLSILFVIFGRLLVRLIQRILYQHGQGVRKVVLIGDSQTSENLMKAFSVSKKLGYEIVKRFSDFSSDSANELEDFLKIKEVDEIIQSDPNLTKAEMIRLCDFADEHHIAFKYVADLLDAKVSNIEVSDIIGIPIIEVKKTPLDGWGRISKRFFDIICSSLLIILLSPILIITAIAIKLDTKGPIFFSKLDDGSPLCRIGFGGRKFRYLKFRSMRDKVDSMRYNELADKNLRADGPLVKIKDDPRVTRVGAFIRRFSIDELPELFLVFFGSMSLVGPRPHLPEEVAKYENRHKKVLTIKPGITGMAQVSGRSDLSFDDEVRLDIYYIENWSLLYDLIILFKTPFAVFKKRQAE